MLRTYLLSSYQGVVLSCLVGDHLGPYPVEVHAYLVGGPYHVVDLLVGLPSSYHRLPAVGFVGEQLQQMHRTINITSDQTRYSTEHRGLAKVW